MLTKKIQPWRYEVLSFFIITSLIGSAWLGLQFLGGGVTTVQRSSFDTQVLASETAQTAEQASLSFNERLQPILNQLPDSYSVVITNTETQEQANHNKYRVQKAASLYKLFVSEEALRLTDAGVWSLSDSFDSARGLDLAACLDIVITISDNGCGVILQERVGARYENIPSLAANGYTQTDISYIYPETTAGDVDRFFQQLLGSSVLSKDSAERLLTNLENQTITNRLPALLPNDTVVAHKTADLEGYIHDAGIIYKNDTPYIITILTEPDNTHYEDRYQAIAELSKQIYNQLD